MTPAESSSPPTTSSGTSSESPLPVTLVLLTFTTGVVDAVSWVGLGHVFTALMTGNVVFLAFAAADIPGLSIARSVVALLAFMLGAVMGGRLHRRMARATHRTWLSWAGGIEAALLLAAVACALGFDTASQPPDWSIYGMIGCTAVAMGFRSATVIRIKDPDFKTTVLTLTITGIAADSSLAGGGNPRVGRRLVAVVALFAGGLTGVLLLKHWGAALPMGVTAAVVVVATLVYVRHPASLKPVTGA